MRWIDPDSPDAWRKEGSRALADALRAARAARKGRPTAEDVPPRPSTFPGPKRKPTAGQLELEGRD